MDKKYQLITVIAVSAFAARQKLWGTKPKELDPPQPAEDKQGDASSGREIPPNRPASTRKRKNQRHDDHSPTSGADTSAEKTKVSRSEQGAAAPELLSDGIQEYVLVWPMLG